MNIQLTGAHVMVEMTTEEALGMIAKIAETSVHANKFFHSAFQQGLGVTIDGKDFPGVLAVIVRKPA